jgi:hypothetical protein
MAKLYRKKITEISFDRPIRIEKIERKLSDTNCWIKNYVPWKDFSAKISVKEISHKRTLYLFVINWRQDFPQFFRVKLNDKVFTPTQLPVEDPTGGTVMFYATLDGKA